MTSTRDRVYRWALHGWSAHDIAEKLGVSDQTVYYHLHRLIADGELEPDVIEPRRRAS